MYGDPRDGERTYQVHFSNNYSTTLSELRCEEQTYPRQHLYGIDALRSAGFDVRICEPQGSAVLDVLSRRARWRLGNLNQAWRSIHRGRPGVVDVAAEPYHVALLAQARGTGWRKQPLVAIFHAPLADTSFSRRLLAGVDVAVCLSKQVQFQFIDTFGRNEETTPWAPWGPDLRFSGYVSTGEDYVVSSGKTLRDPEVLARALDGTGIPALVHGATRSTSEVTAINPSDHLDRGRGREPQLPYETVLLDLQKAAVVAVPLSRHERLAGLSEVADALALGKPLVVTESRWLDIDVQAIGCGIAVQEGDTEGWRRALTKLWSDPALRHQMGSAGRRYAESSCNADLFGEALVRATRLAIAL